MNNTAKFTTLYARVPKVKCKGLCTDNCSVISCSTWEAKRMERDGARVPHEDPLQCPFLSIEGKCSAYDSRPLICRLFGAAEGLPCEHGCEVDGEPISDELGTDLANASIAIGGPMAILNSREELDRFIAQTKDAEALNP